MYCIFFLFLYYEMIKASVSQKIKITLCNFSQSILLSKS